jgi:hypothetical protein
MRISRSELFERLDPPPGGVTRLRAAIERHDRRRLEARRVRSLCWAAAAAAATVLVWLAATWLSHPDGDVGRNRLALGADGADPALVGLGLADPPAERVSVPPAERHRVAVERVEVDVPGVVYYRVAVVSEVKLHAKPPASSSRGPIGEPGALDPRRRGVRPG